MKHATLRLNVRFDFAYILLAILVKVEPHRVSDKHFVSPIGVVFAFLASLITLSFKGDALLCQQLFQHNDFGAVVGVLEVV